MSIRLRPSADTQSTHKIDKLPTLATTYVGHDLFWPRSHPVGHGQFWACSRVKGGQGEGMGPKGGGPKGEGKGDPKGAAARAFACSLVDLRVLGGEDGNLLVKLRESSGMLGWCERARERAWMSWLFLLLHR